MNSEGKVGRPRSLSSEQAAELLRRFELWRDNRPTALAKHYGISTSTVSRYGHSQAKPRGPA